MDCLNFFTLPGLAWSLALKYTGVELELLTSPEEYLMLEGSVRGGISTVSCRKGNANNSQLEDRPLNSSLPNKFLTYIDANNLYGFAMSQSLPVGDFKFLTDGELDDFLQRLNDIADDGEIGYVVECDLHYPHDLHDRHNAYPMAPEHLLITDLMLSPYVTKSFPDIKWAPSKKLVPNLYDKTKYVVHYRNLKLYVKHGLVITKIHRVLSFRQKPWLKTWIDYCTLGRRMATSEFQSDNFKLNAKACFGKSLQNVRDYKNIRLIADPKRLKTAVSKYSFKCAEIISPDLTLVQMQKQMVKLNQPIYTGFAILELSKLLMYQFYYEYLMVRYGHEKCLLLYTDTNSFILEIETNDLYADMLADSAW